jgi:hypothetical protein
MDIMSATESLKHGNYDRSATSSNATGFYRKAITSQIQEFGPRQLLFL